MNGPRGMVVVAVFPALPACSVFGGDPIQQQFEERDQLPSCGALNLDQAQTLKDQKAELACMKDALKSGNGAELKVEHPTIEGDPIVSYYRVLSDGSTEVYVDSTKDGYSDQKWSFASCAVPKSILDVNC